MGSVSVKIHQEFQARAARMRIGPSGRPLRELAPLLADRPRPKFGDWATTGLGLALSILLELLLGMGFFLGGALAFVYFSARW